MSLRTVKITAVLILAVALIALQWFQFDASRHHSSTSFSDGPLGTSIFLNLVREFAPAKLRLLRRAIFSPDELGGSGSLLIISSPLGDLSEREVGIVREFVEAGGQLWLSCHEEACRESVSRMAGQFGASFATEINQAYQAGVPERLVFEQSEVFQPGDYAFYGARSFYGNNNYKFVRRISVGQGAVFLISSVVPLANGLIGQGDNWRLAQRIIRQSHTIVIDEYHHFFSERGVGDLLMTPWVSLPMLGLLLAALAFFLFGESPLNEKSEQSLRAPSFHRFNQDALRGLLSNKQVYQDALARQQRVVRRAQAHSTAQLGVPVLGNIRALAHQHRELLRLKRGLTR